MQQKRKLWTIGIGTVLVATTAVIAQRLAVRQAAEDVNSAPLRRMAGLRPNQNLLFNGWGLTPAGRHVRLAGDMPLKMVLSPDGQTLAAVTGGFEGTGLTLLDSAGRNAPQFLPLARAWNGIAWSKDGKRLFVTGGNSGLLHTFDYAEGKATPARSIAPAPNAPDAAASATPVATAGGLPTLLAGIAVHPQTGKLYIANEGGHEVWIVNPETLLREAVVPVGMHPHSCAFGADRRYLYVTNWGSRSVSVVDTLSGRRVRDIRVGVRPNDLTLARDGRVFVACSGDNTVHVIQTQVLEQVEGEANPSIPPPENAREIISTSLYPASPEGSTPDGVAVAPDGQALYVANADNNCVMAVDISDPTISRVAGFIPVGWYPTAVAVSADNNTLMVANGKGLMSRANAPAQLPSPNRYPRRSEPTYDYIGKILEGSLSFITRPNAGELVRYTEQVRRNSPYTPQSLRQAPFASNSVIPDRVGAPCPIKYVLYIIKENRTYDQILGDFRDARGKRAGNGDPKLVLYGEDVTPNHHQLARDYVLLDNLFCNGEVSVDGHSWCDGAIATDYRQRSWIMSYSKHGDLPGNEELSKPSAGFLWDLCRRQGVSYRNYGEGARDVPTTNRGVWTGARDMNKVDNWIRDLQAAQKSGNLPQFTIMSLGEDHTRGTTPGAFTPEAAVASNDIGVGKIVAAASRSRFWNEMAIFIIEDDAQNGADHVDAHRTVGLVISPYVKRGVVDSTLYTTASMIRTMELILGMPPLTQYDAGATPMFNTFQKRAQSTPYRLRTPRVDVNARNKPTAPGAQASARMNWEKYDDFDGKGEDTLNRILWRAAKGPNVPYPAPIHRAVFTRPQALTTSQSTLR